jgi:DNA-binding response OmpR family regulator
VYTGKTILVVDDMGQIRDTIRFHLKEEGYNVVLAENGEQALKYALGKNPNPPDLIVMDINMPIMDGYEVTKQLRESDKTKNVPVIFLTANARKEDILKGMEVGGSDYVVKPFMFADLLKKIKTLINQE